MKKMVLTVLSTISIVAPVGLAYGAENIKLDDAELSAIKNFAITSNKKDLSFSSSGTNKNQLHELNKTSFQGKSYTRYQQYYNGIKIFGAEVVVGDNKVNGEINKNLDNLNFSLINKSNQDIAEKIVKTDFIHSILAAHKWNYKIIEAEPIILVENNQEILGYQIILQATQSGEAPKLLNYIIDIKNNKILKKWNEVKSKDFLNYKEYGDGGNAKTGRYIYGQNGIPNLYVTKLSNGKCQLSTSRLRVVDVQHASENYPNYKIDPVQYTCGNLKDYTNESYNPMNDAMYLGNKTYEMYSNWYGVNLNKEFKRYNELVLRVHMDYNYENAFWDPQTETMNFGDGADNFYSLASSLDVMAHEVSHGITQYHSRLIYEGQSGALNESFSDMAGVTAADYLARNVNSLFSLQYKSYNNLWVIGFSIVKPVFGMDGLRYMDRPSRDGVSADCYDPTISSKVGEKCYRSYGNIVQDAKRQDPDGSGGFLVHTASGIFNKAFYLMSQKIGVQKAFEVAVKAQFTKWTALTDFSRAACSMKQIAVHSGKMTRSDADLIFAKVGIDTASCN